MSATKRNPSRPLSHQIFGAIGQLVLEYWYVFEIANLRGLCRADQIFFKHAIVMARSLNYWNTVVATPSSNVYYCYPVKLQKVEIFASSPSCLPALAVIKSLIQHNSSSLRDFRLQGSCRGWWRELLPHMCLCNVNQLRNLVLNGGSPRTGTDPEWSNWVLELCKFNPLLEDVEFGAHRITLKDLNTFILGRLPLRRLKLPAGVSPSSLVLLSEYNMLEELTIDLHPVRDLNILRLSEFLPKFVALQKLCVDFRAGVINKSPLTSPSLISLKIQNIRGGLPLINAPLLETFVIDSWMELDGESFTDDHLYQSLVSCPRIRHLNVGNFFTHDIFRNVWKINCKMSVFSSNDYFTSFPLFHLPPLLKMWNSLEKLKLFFRINTPSWILSVILYNLPSLSSISLSKQGANDAEVNVNLISHQVTPLLLAMRPPYILETADPDNPVITYYKHQKLTSLHTEFADSSLWRHWSFPCLTELSVSNTETISLPKVLPLRLRSLRLMCDDSSVGVVNALISACAGSLCQLTLWSCTLYGCEQLLKGAFELPLPRLETINLPDNSALFEESFYAKIRRNGNANML